MKTLSALEEDLLTVLKGRGELYGLTILELINSVRDFHKRPELKIGSLYPTLDRMENQDLVISRRTPPRRYYTITAEGEKLLLNTQAYRKSLRLQTRDSLLI